MEIDLGHPGTDSVSLGEVLRARVCVVGGGIAGLLVARRLLRSGISVTVLEAGGHEVEGVQCGDPFAAELGGRGHPGTREGRVCALGGCSLTWGGQLLPLPEAAEWSVPRAELQGFVAEAEREFGVDALPYGAADLFGATGMAAPEMLRLGRGPHGHGFEMRASKFVPFGRRNLAATFGREIADHALGKAVLHAAVVEVVLTAAQDRIEAVIVSAPGGGRVRVGAEEFVLAAGTVETCRLLLASRAVAAAGVGNGHGQVGVRFQDHLTMPAAVFRGAARERAIGELGPRVFEAGAGATVHSPKLESGAGSDAARGEHWAMAHVTVKEPEGSGVALVRELLRARQQGGLRRVLRGHAGELPAALLHAIRLGWSAGLRHRRYVSPGAAVRLQINMAQDAGTRSRVGLGERSDRFGVPRARVEWEISAAELAGLRRFAGRVRGLMGEAGLEEGVEWEPALFESGAAADERLLSLVDDARHAMGGACMGTDPRSSVVDPELRVHGVANLSVASAAVFPDGSAQLPTLTLGALSLRLADRMARQLG